MADRAEGSIEIEASPPEILSVISGFEAYPEWAEGIKSADVRTRDDDGRGSEVAFEFEAMGLGASYTLVYEYPPEGVRWTTREASGAVKDVAGEYVLEEQGGSTLVTYRLEIELAMPVPGFMKRQGEKRAIKTALQGLKHRVEEP